MDSALKRHLPRSAQTIDRRGFLNILSSSAILTAVPVLPVDPPGLAGPSSRSRISLNGEWEHRVDGKFYETITVPSSRRPSGFYSLNRQFVLPRFGRGDRAFVHFEAITCWGRVSRMAGNSARWARTSHMNSSLRQSQTRVRTRSQSQWRTFCRSRTVRLSPRLLWESIPDLKRTGESFAMCGWSCVRPLSLKMCGWHTS